MTHLDSTSLTLLERLRTPHDDAAWRRFVNLYVPLLFAWARKLGLQESDAADLVQDVLLLLTHKLPQFELDASKSFRGWLRTVALNQLRAGLRRRAAQPGQIELFAEELPASVDEAFWEAEYRQHLVGRALQLMQAEFNAATWKACWECVVQGRSASDVGAELGLSPGAVRVAKFRVLSRLRQELDGMLD